MEKYKRLSAYPLTTNVVFIECEETARKGAAYEGSASCEGAECEKQIADTLADIGLGAAKPTLVLIGGASQISKSDYRLIQSLFADVISPLADKLGCYVVDGGTDAGIIRLIGQARRATQATFPLVGITPVDLLDLPNFPAAEEDSAPLEANHTHCIAVPGRSWGDESAWMAKIATLLAGDRPSVVLLINGGSITWKDAAANAAVGRQILVLEGSGRAADLLVDTLKGKSTSDERALALAGSGLLEAVSLCQGAKALSEKLTAKLS